MILSKNEQLLTAYAPTAQATNVNGDYYDAGIAVDLGAGEPVMFYVQVDALATSSGSATVRFLLQADSDPAFGTVVTVLSSPLVAEAMSTMVAGREFKNLIPPGFVYRYWRAAVVIATADLTAGTFASWIGNENFQNNRPYAAGFTVK